MQLHYRSTGTGEPVVILHGLFGMLDNWQTFARHLGESYEVITVDLRNHGRSPHSDVFDYPALASDIRELISTLGFASVTLMGHSLGGKTAMQTALLWPGLIDRLIVIDIAPRAYAPGHDQILTALQSINPASHVSRNEIESTLMAALGDIGIVRFLMKNVGRKEDGSLHWKMNLPVLAEAYDETISAVSGNTQYQGPALFVRGGRSSYIRDEDLAGIYTLFPGAALETIPEAGHWVHADAMEDLLEVVRRFLTAHPRN